MSVTEHLTLVYHQQDTENYCGAACAQMVLDSIGAGILLQEDLYAENQAASITEPPPVWSTSPDGLLWVMRHHRPAGFNRDFALFGLANEESISRKIVWTIHHYQVSPIAVVYHSQHWVVVRGYTATASPSGSADVSYSMIAFDINDPSPATPGASDPALAPPPPHAAGDDCGTGGDRGLADEHISYATWQDTYMTGVDFGHWSGQYLAVCDPYPPPVRPGLRGFVPPRRAGNVLIDSQDVVSLIREGFSMYSLLTRPEYASAIERTTFGRPVLVQRLDRRDMFYYITAAEDSERVSTPLAAIIDARTGEYRQSIVTTRERVRVFTPLGPEEAARLVIGKKLELPHDRGHLLVRPEAACHYPILVWKPCRESLSPYRPFHMFTVGTQPLYVRTDGAVFTALHDQGHGI